MLQCTGFRFFSEVFFFRRAHTSTAAMLVPIFKIKTMAVINISEKLVHK